MRGVVLRHELSRLASEKGADPSIVGLAKNSAALQSRLVELKASCAGWRPGIERIPNSGTRARIRFCRIAELIISKCMEI